MHGHTLILKTTDPEMLDPEGKLFPQRGLISSDDFSPDDDLSNGFKGLYWDDRKGLFLSKDPTHSWLVIGIEPGLGLIEVQVGFRKLVKFREGYVIHCGNEGSARNYASNAIKVEVL
jgi:hypothetical protein